MQQADLVTVYTLNDPVQAELIKNSLQADGIKCLLAGIEQASTAGVPGTIIQVQVLAADADRAKKLIQSREP